MSRRSSHERKGPWDVAGVRMRAPVIVGSGPLTSKLSLLSRAEKAGAGGVSLKLTFVKPPFESEMRSFSLHDTVILSPAERRLAMDEGVELCRAAKKETGLAVWANYSAGNIDDWLRLTEAFAEAGADGFELNFCCPNIETGYGKGGKKTMHGGALICADPGLVRSIVRSVRGRFPEIPLLPKVVHNTHLFKEVVEGIAEAGADGVHVVGEPVSGAPPVNPETLKPMLPFAKGVSFGSTNGAICIYSTLRCVAEARSAAPDLDVAASGGVSDWKDAVSLYAYGADGVAICSAIMWHGWGVVTKITADLKDYFAGRGETGPEGIRGKALSLLVPPTKLILSKKRARIDRDACIGCGRCAQVGHCEAITMRERRAQVDEAKCISCGVCRSLCPVRAIVYDDDPRYEGKG